MVQSRTDAEGTDDVPIVMHRRDREKWKVTMDLGDFMEMYIAATSVDAPRFPTCALHNGSDMG